MKRSIYYYLLLTAIYAGIFLAARAQSDKPKQITSGSISDTPLRKIPVFIITIPRQELYRMFDTSNMIMSDYGIEMGKSQARNAEILMANQWNRLVEKYARLDSVKVGGKP